MSEGSPVKTALQYGLAWLLLGYGGFQLAGWTGAILLPIGATAALALIAAPVAVFVVGSALIIHTVQGFRAVKRRIYAHGGRGESE